MFSSSFLRGLWFGLLMTVSVFSQTYRDDSLVVKEILTANGLDSISVDVVSSNDGGERIYLLAFTDIDLKILPECIGKLTELTELYIRNASLMSLPDSLGELHQLEYLDISYTSISSLPPSLSRCNKLTTIKIPYNSFSEWPQVLHSITGLDYVDISYNRITSIPVEVGGYKNLKYLYINNNQLTDLPLQITSLDLIMTGVAGNRLCDLPPQIALWLDSFHLEGEFSNWKMLQDCSSSAVNVSRSKSTQNASVKFSMNPHRSGVLQVNFLLSTIAGFTVYTLSGRQMFSLPPQQYNTGFHRVSMKSARLTSGTYLLKMATDNAGTQMVKFRVN